LVEDEVLIRMMIADMVEELGHRVVAEAGNVQDARALAETIFFDIAILDINIAGSSIAPVATIIARRGLPFFFVSGYGLAGRPKAFIERPALQKPVSISILGETINAILATAGKASSRADDSLPNIQWTASAAASSCACCWLRRSRLSGIC
jgi:DNA-binding response OmpR family regulator